MGIDDNWDMDLDPLAMIFRPFETTHKSYADLASLLAEYDVPLENKVVMVNSGLDEVHVYLGKKSATDTNLLNFRGFVAFNQLEVRNNASIVWTYDVIIAVGFNALLQEHVDIPAAMFPWPRAIFSYSDNPSILNVPLTIDQPIAHTLASKCLRCARNKKLCMPLPGMKCGDCKDGQCEMSATEENARTRQFFNVLAESAFALCPAYQHLIQSVKAAIKYGNGEPRIPYRDRATLKSLVRCGDIEMSHGIVRVYGDSMQRVSFRNGKLCIEEEKDMEGVYGFETQDAKRASKLRCAVVIPHFGLASPQLVYSFIDSVLSMPGKIHWVESSVMNRKGGFRTARIVMVAGIVSEDHMTFTVAWRFKA